MLVKGGRGDLQTGHCFLYPIQPSRQFSWKVCVHGVSIYFLACSPFPPGTISNCVRQMGQSPYESNRTSDTISSRATLNPFMMRS